MNNHPKVLLLGNGLNRAYGDASWTELLEGISTENFDKNRITDLKMSMPLQAILVSGNDVKTGLRKYYQNSDNKKEIFQPPANTEMQDRIEAILTAGFDHILTTNYSYELESVACRSFLGRNLTETNLKTHSKVMTGADVLRAEPKYMLHTYNSYRCGDIDNRIWHIHGELRKPDSMILGHYYYGNLFSRIYNYVDQRTDAYIHGTNRDAKAITRSWIDAFILGDVYVLGYGFDFSEFDMWWLLNRKANEKSKTGRIYYYAPKPFGSFDEKEELFSTFKTTEGEKLVTINHLGEELLDENCSKNKEINRKMFLKFYGRAINDILREVHSSGRTEKWKQKN